VTSDTSTSVGVAVASGIEITIDSGISLVGKVAVVWSSIGGVGDTSVGASRTSEPRSGAVGVASQTGARGMSVVCAMGVGSDARVGGAVGSHVSRSITVRVNSWISFVQKIGRVWAGSGGGVGVGSAGVCATNTSASVCTSVCSTDTTVSSASITVRIDSWIDLVGHV